MDELIKIKNPKQLSRFKTWATRNINRSLMESCLGLGNIPKKTPEGEWDLNQYQANDIIREMFENTLIMYKELLTLLNDK